MSSAVLRSDRLTALRGKIAGLGAAAACLPHAVGLPEGLLPERSALRPLWEGGQAFGGLHEIVAAGSRDLPAAAGFALDFMVACSRSGSRRGLVLIIEDFVCWEQGVPFGPGLVETGLDMGSFLLVRTGSPSETLAAMEAALRSRAVAGVLAETAISPRHYDLATSRRLLMAARAGGGAALVLPVAFAGHGERLSSAATARFEIARARSCGAPYGRALPLPGRPAFSFRVLKAPGGLTDQAARARDRWEGGVLGPSTPEAAFHAFSFDPSPVPVDRSRSSPGGECIRKVA